MCCQLGFARICWQKADAFALSSGRFSTAGLRINMYSSTRTNSQTTKFVSLDACLEKKAWQGHATGSTDLRRKEIDWFPLRFCSSSTSRTYVCFSRCLRGVNDEVAAHIEHWKNPFCLAGLHFWKSLDIELSGTPDHLGQGPVIHICNLLEALIQRIGKLDLCAFHTSILHRCLKAVNLSLPQHLIDGVQIATVS